MSRIPAKKDSHQRAQGSQDNLHGSHLVWAPGIEMHQRALATARSQASSEMARVDVHKRLLPCPRCGEVYRRKRVEFVAADGTCVQTDICARRSAEMLA